MISFAHGTAQARRTFHRSAAVALGLVLCAMLVLTTGVNRAEAALGTIGTPGYLGNAESFAVVAGTEITNVFVQPVPQTVVNGDMAVSPGAVVTGFGAGEGVVNGAIHTSTTGVPAGSIAADAKADADAAWTDVDTNPALPAATPVAANLGGQSLIAGVYTPLGGADFEVTGTLTLTGDWDDIFVFKTPNLTTAANNSVVVLNGANPCNIYWRITSSAVLEENTSFVGTLLAGTSITVGQQTTVGGRLFAGTGNVTLIHDQISTPTCLTAPAAGGGTSTTSGTTSGLANSGTESTRLMFVGLLLSLVGVALVATSRLRKSRHP